MLAYQATPARTINREAKPDLSRHPFWKTRSANTFRGRPTQPPALAGFFLLEAMLVLMIFGVVLSMTTSHASNAFRIFSGVKAAAQLRHANDVVQDFVLRYAGEIKNQLSERPGRESLTITHEDNVKTIPIRWHRQENEYVWIIESKELVKIATHIHRPAPHFLSAVRLSLHPRDDNFDTCKDPGTSIKNCRIETVTYRKQAIYRSGAPDWVALNAGLRSLKAGGGLSLSIQPDTIRFHNEDEVSSFSKNPIHSKPGILAIRSEQAPHHRPYLDLRYGHMFGTINMDNKGINRSIKLTAEQVKLNQSAQMVFKDPQSLDALTFTTGGISTTHWEWRFPKTIFNTADFARKDDADGATLKETIFNNGVVETTKADVDASSIRRLIFTGSGTTKECSTESALAFDKQGKPAYCKGKIWYPLD